MKIWILDFRVEVLECQSHTEDCLIPVGGLRTLIRSYAYCSVTDRLLIVALVGTGVLWSVVCGRWSVGRESDAKKIGP